MISCLPVFDTCLAAIPLHAMNTVGIDTDAGRSISTRREDFMCIDKSSRAINSVGIRGVDGGSAIVGGIGAMVVQTRTSIGQEVFIIDPEGVFVYKGDDDSDFRVLGQ